MRSFRFALAPVVVCGTLVACSDAPSGGAPAGGGMDAGVDPGSAGPDGGHSSKDAGGPGDEGGPGPGTGTDGGPAPTPESGSPDGGSNVDLPSGNLFVGYYESWSDSYAGSNGAETPLARLPSYVNVVNVSFMQPDTTYQPGSLVLRGTTYLDLQYDGPTLKAAILALHQANPNTRVLISVGGATLYNWGSFHPDAVAAVVKDFGFDGVDLDYEPGTPNCTVGAAGVTCPTDAEYIRVVNAMRAALPRPKILSAAVWSVGAYGEGQWANSQPTGSASTGIALAVLKDPKASAALDLLNVMSYDAGPTYNPKEALAAYQHYFKGKIAMGIEVPPEAWGGHVETTAEIDSLARAVSGSGGAGLMLWAIQKPTQAQTFATEMCTKLGLSSCTTPMLK